MRKRALRLTLGAVAGLGAIALFPTIANAQEPDPVTVLGQQVNLLWVVIGAILVIFMQAGIRARRDRLLSGEARGPRRLDELRHLRPRLHRLLLHRLPARLRRVQHIAASVWMSPVGEPLLGSGNWVFLFQGGWALSTGTITPALLGLFLYMVAFMDTVATIPTGSMAERWKWGSFVDLGPVLRRHLLPAVRGVDVGRRLAGEDVGHDEPRRRLRGLRRLRRRARRRWRSRPRRCIVLGARIGKFDADGTPKAIPGHHIPMALLGTFILLFGWFGFNAASTFAATDVQFATVATNTAIAGAFGAIIAMLWITKRTGKPDPGMMANGMLAGLVAITAPCAFVAPWAAAVIGCIAGVLVIESVFFVERKLKVDDPVGAISVHGVCGTFGVLAVGIFSNGSYGAGWNGSDSEGVEGIIKGDWGQLGAQALGLAVIWTVIFGIAFGFFKTPGQDLQVHGQGRHPLQRGRRDRRSRHPGDGRRRIPRVREPLSGPREPGALHETHHGNRQTVQAR